MTKNECDALMRFAERQMEAAKGLLAVLSPDPDSDVSHTETQSHGEGADVDVSHAETRSCGEGTNGSREKREKSPTPPKEIKESCSTGETRARAKKPPTLKKVTDYVMKYFPTSIPAGWVQDWYAGMEDGDWQSASGKRVTKWRQYLRGAIINQMRDGFAGFTGVPTTSEIGPTFRPTEEEVRLSAKLRNISDDEVKQFLDDMTEADWQYVTNAGAMVYVNRRNYVGIMAAWARTNRRQAKLAAHQAEREAKMDAKWEARNAKLDAKAAEREAKLDAKMDAYRAERDAKIAAERQQQRLSSIRCNAWL